MRAETAVEGVAVEGAVAEKFEVMLWEAGRPGMASGGRTAGDRRPEEAVEGRLDKACALGGCGCA